MDDLVDQIAQLDPLLFDQAFDAFIKRYAEVFPDYDFITITLHKRDDRCAQIDSMIQWLQSLKTLP